MAFDRAAVTQEQCSAHCSNLRTIILLVTAQELWFVCWFLACSDARTMIHAFNIVCSGDHDHAPVAGVDTSLSAAYPLAFCKNAARVILKKPDPRQVMAWVGAVDDEDIEMEQATPPDVAAPGPVSGIPRPSTAPIKPTPSSAPAGEYSDNPILKNFSQSERRTCVAIVTSYMWR